MLWKLALDPNGCLPQFDWLLLLWFAYSLIKWYYVFVVDDLWLCDKWIDFFFQIFLHTVLSKPSWFRFQDYTVYQINSVEKWKISSYTVWKLQNFSVNQILREINSWDSRSAKSAILTHLETLDFDFLNKFLYFL